MTAANQSLYLCLDQGGHASRAIVIDGEGAIHAQAFQAIDTQREAGRVEHSPEQIVSTLQAAAEEAVASLGSAADKIVAAGFATQRSSIVCWHRESGDALSPVISWQDTRAAQWLENFHQNEPEIHRITGLMLSPHYGVSKLRWCLDHIPEVRHAYESRQLVFGPLASFIVNQMIATGPVLADPANASRTLLWDRYSRDWSIVLSELFTIPVDCLPDSVPSRHHWGELAVAGRMIPVTVVTGDQSAALFAFGMPRAGIVYANLGTGAFLQQSVGADAADPGRLLASVVYQDASHVTSVIEATVNGAGSAINLVCDQLGMDHGDMRANSSKWLLQSTRLPLFVNGVAGLGSPWWLPDVDSQFIGEGTPEEKIAAVIESVAFLIAVNLQAMARLGYSPGQIIVTGGLGSVTPLLQRMSDLSGVAVQRADVAEATARGLAYLLAELPSDWPVVEVSESFQPQKNPALQRRFERWCEAMPPVVD